MKTPSAWKSSAIVGLLMAALSLAGCQEEISSKGTPDMKVYTTIEAPGLERRWVQPNGPTNVVPILISEGTWNDKKWRLYDTGMRVTNGSSKIYWADEDHLIFNGGWAEPGKRGDGSTGGIILWNLLKGISRYKNESALTCAANGVVRIGLWNENNREKGTSTGEFLLGPLGNEVVTKFFRKWYGHRTDWKWSFADCKYQTVPREYLTGAKKKRRFEPLRVDHGYMDFGPNTVWQADKKDFRYIYHSHTDGKEHPLPIPYEAIGPDCIRYFPHRGAYLLKRCDSSLVFVRQALWRGNTPPNCVDYWWLSPDGKTEKECLKTPYLIDIVRQNKIPQLNIQPTQMGPLITLEEHIGENGLNEQGLYWGGVSEEQAFLLGDVHAKSEFSTSVSPDGCKFAFAFGRMEGSFLSRKSGIMVLDVCVEGPLPASAWELSSD